MDKLMGVNVDECFSSDEEEVIFHTDIKFIETYKNVFYESTHHQYSNAMFVSEADDVFCLDGMYTLKFCIQPIANCEQIKKIGDIIINIWWKYAFSCGYILYNVNEPEIMEKIKLLVNTTYCTTELPDYLSLPTKQSKIDTIFYYDNCEFNLYSRYIYGYNHLYTKLQHITNVDTKFVELDVDENNTLIHSSGVYPEKPILSDNLIKIPGNNEGDGYLHAFTIINQRNVLVAFGLYSGC
ncbi:hypothetical protein [Psilogramma increta granulovirus]|uniref:Uncharacterized protein n=1 Tax=Psilogramma increta granulovirus TaxID=2953508 RepID=A0A977TNZ1_9BBAC|nr:hypothetical protein [Psilogramma increta granulovirus]